MASERNIRHLVDMGISLAQARAALAANRDVNDAAQQIFEGRFDHVSEAESGNLPDRDANSSSTVVRIGIETPPAEDNDEGDSDSNQSGQDSDELLEGGDSEEEFDAYDSDDDFTSARNALDASSDPYAGIFFSKDRREEIIEVEDPFEYVTLDDGAQLPLMSQGEWMKGCPEGSEQSLLFQLYFDLHENSFSADCSHNMKRDQRMFFAMHTRFSTYIYRLRQNVQASCPKCQTLICLGCAQRIDLTKASSSSYDPLLHCAPLQGVIVGMGLASLEKMQSDDQDTIRPSQSDAKMPKKRKSPGGSLDPIEDDDVASFSSFEGQVAKKPRGSTTYAGGTGYAGNVQEDRSGQQQAWFLQRRKDAQLSELMICVRNFLPDLNRKGGPQTSDFMVHPTTLAHIRRRFNPIASLLLRNDSLPDMSERHALYYELFRWFELISRHEALASIMGMPIMLVASTATFTPSTSVKLHTTSKQRKLIYEGSSGPRELAESIVIQARAALRGLGPLGAEAKPVETTSLLQTSQDNTSKVTLQTFEENDVLRSFCEKIIATVKAVDESLRKSKGEAFMKRLFEGLPNSVTPSAGKVIVTTSNSYGDSLKTIYDDVPLGGTEDQVRTNYVDWAKKVRFQYCDMTATSAANATSSEPGKESATHEDAIPNYVHAHNSKIRDLAKSDFPKRSLAIAKELATLSMNLPVAWASSVFLMVDDTRVDVVKALIIGPEDTPYQNGCFMFDIFLGSTYNQQPPLVKYMTTNDGLYRFNPNLYADGKVCLSLLGTWNGPGWVPGKSTLLQVLISIQSMILNEEPYLNEPGWANSGGSLESKAYSANVRRMTTRTAILRNMKTPPAMFADVIRTHFRFKRVEVEKQLDEWLAIDDGRNIDGPNHGTAAANLRPISAETQSGGTLNGMKKDVDEIKSLLQLLTANADQAER